MQAIKSKVTKAIPIGSEIGVCDNSGAKVVKVFTAMGSRTTRGRVPSAGVSDLVMVSVRRGRPDIRKQVFYAVIVRQKKEYRRADGTRIKFEDNSAVILKDDKGNPKGTIFKGAIAKEVTERWPGIAKIASIVV